MPPPPYPAPAAYPGGGTGSFRPAHVDESPRGAQSAPRPLLSPWARPTRLPSKRVLNESPKLGVSTFTPCAGCAPASTGALQRQEPTPGSARRARAMAP